MSEFEFSLPMENIDDTTNPQTQPDTTEEFPQQHQTMPMPQVIVQPPPPSVKEIKMKEPTPFTGDRRKLDSFLLEIEMFLRMNGSIYDTDEKKIIYALSFMREGTAGPWKHSYWNAYSNFGFSGTWAGFKNSLRNDFSPVDKKGEAMNKMMTERQGERTADEYIEQFKIWHLESGIQDQIVLIDWFAAGLNNKLEE